MIRILGTARTYESRIKAIVVVPYVSIGTILIWRSYRNSVIEFYRGFDGKTNSNKSGQRFRWPVCEGPRREIHLRLYNVIKRATCGVFDYARPFRRHLALKSPLAMNAWPRDLKNCCVGARSRFEADSKLQIWLSIETLVAWTVVTRKLEWGLAPAITT